MKAIWVREFGGPEVLKLEDTPDPRPAQSGEVLIRVKAAGVNPYDTYMRAGGYGARNPALPYTPGSDAAGVVESAGADVDLKVGDRVYTTLTITGAYAELALCRSSQVQSLPGRVNFSQGAGVYVPYATAYRALFQVARTKPGETVLVHGASGGVGVAAIQFAIAAGIKIIGSAGSSEGLKLIKTEGAQHTVNHSSAIPLPHFEFRFCRVNGSWQQYLTANSDRLSHFGRRMSLFLQTLALRGILSKEQEHRKEHMNLGAGGAAPPGGAENG